MRSLFFLFCIGFMKFSFAQNASDLGKMTFEQVKSLQTVTPCEITPNKALRYCSEDGNIIFYMFDDNKLSGIIFLTAFLTRSAAELGLTNMVNEFSKIINMKPAFTSGMALFNITDKIAITYEIKEMKGTYYVAYSTLLL